MVVGSAVAGVAGDFSSGVQPPKDRKHVLHKLTMVNMGRFFFMDLLQHTAESELHFVCIVSYYRLWSEAFMCELGVYMLCWSA